MKAYSADDGTMNEEKLNEVKRHNSKNNNDTVYTVNEDTMADDTEITNKEKEILTEECRKSVMESL